MKRNIILWAILPLVLVMFENLKLVNENSVEYDLGLYHMSISLGIQFNFFGIF